jgi:hypothetical protein
MFGAAFSGHPLAMEERMYDAAKTRLLKVAQVAEQRYAMTAHR